MIKIVQFLCLFTLAFTLNANAQFVTDDFDSYEEGYIGPQADHWTTWLGNEGTPEDGIISTDQANSGSQSMYIGPGQVQDVLLLLGNESSGNLYLSWHMYVDDQGSAYWNIQESETPGINWNLEVAMGSDNMGTPTMPGLGIVVQEGALLTEFQYEFNTWMHFEHFVDMDNDIIVLTKDGETLIEAPYLGGLGAIDFFSINNDNSYYIDDVIYSEVATSITANFSVDMNYEEVSDDGVFVVVNGGDPVEMSDDDEDGIWEASVDLGEEPDSPMTYYFVNGDEAEDISGDCADGGERSAEVDDDDLDLETVCFGECTDCGTIYLREVTFSVDVSYLESVDDAGIHLAASFNDWDPTQNPLEDEDEDGIWETTILLDKNMEHTYRFYNGAEESEVVPEGCSVDVDGTASRSVTLEEEATTLETVCFSECTDCISANSVAVTFSVDVELLANEGNLNEDGLLLTGSFLEVQNPADGEAIELTLAEGEEYIYEAVVTLSKNQQYTYVFVNGNTWSDAEFITDDCAEDGTGRRVLDLGDEDTVLETVCFDACSGPCIPTGINEQALASFDLYPNPASEQVFLVNPFATNEQVQVEIYNHIGQLIEAQNTMASNKQIELNISDLAADLYFVKISNGQESFAQRLVVVK